MKIGYHASHEQHAPGALLALVQHAERSGFEAVLASDHFHPWLPGQGQSAFVWSWLGAALQGTEHLSFGTVNAPGYRYHPAIIAQAAATLAAMFPQRFWFSVGSGEALNESITGGRWPAKQERNERLRECVDIMRALWRGETVTHHGLVTVEDARLYTLPEEPPQLAGAALTPETAEWLGGWADALITVGGPPDQVRELVDAFRAGGGAGKPMKVQVGLSWAPTEEEAVEQAHTEWGWQPFPSSVINELRSPAAFAGLRDAVAPEHMKETLHVSADLGRHAAWLNDYIELGFDEIYLFNVGRNQRAFIDAFAAHVLPRGRR